MSDSRAVSLDHKYSTEETAEISQGMERVLQALQESQTSPLEKLVQEQATQYQAYSQSLDAFSAAITKRSKTALGILKEIKASMQLPYQQMSESLKKLEGDQDKLLKEIESENKKQGIMRNNAALNGQKTKTIEDGIKHYLTKETEILAFNKYIDLINSHAAESKSVFISFIPRKHLADQQCGQCVKDLQTLRNEVKKLKPVTVGSNPNAYFRQYSPGAHSQPDLFSSEEEKKRCCCVLL